MIDPVEVRLPELWAAVKEADAAHTDATRRLGEARHALAVGQRDDWIARARAAYPLPEGAVEGWVTETGHQWCGVPGVGYATLVGRLVAVGVVEQKDIKLTIHRQRRNEYDEVVEVTPDRVEHHQLRHRAGKEWAQRLGVTA